MLDIKPFILFATESWQQVFLEFSWLDDQSYANLRGFLAAVKVAEPSAIINEQDGFDSTTIEISGLGPEGWACWSGFKSVCGGIIQYQIPYD